VPESTQTGKVTVNGYPLQSLIEEAAERRRQREYEEYVFGFKAMMLAPTIEVYHALLRGEDVPLHMLNQEAVSRYGLRRRDAA
jgi:hypothetical protein